MATLAELDTAIADNTTAVAALTAAVGSITPTDFQPQVDAVTANTTGINAAVAILTGPPSP